MRIERDNAGFSIYLSDGKRGGYKAANLEEVVAALRHHLGDSGELGENLQCPLCRAIHTEMEALANGRTWRTA